MKDNVNHKTMNKFKNVNFCIVYVTLSHVSSAKSAYYTDTLLLERLLECNKILFIQANGT